MRSALGVDAYAAKRPPAAGSKQDARNRAFRVEGAGRDVGRVVQVGALVEGTDGRRTCGAARVPDTVHRRCGRGVANPMTARAQTAAKVGVLPIHEVALVESAD